MRDCIFTPNVFSNPYLDDFSLDVEDREVYHKQLKE